MDYIGIDAVFYVGGAISLLGTVIFAVMMQRSARAADTNDIPGSG